MGSPSAVEPGGLRGATPREGGHLPQTWQAMGLGGAGDVTRDCDITEWRWSEGYLGPPPGERAPSPDKMEDPEKNRAGNSPERGAGRGARP